MQHAFRDFNNVTKVKCFYFLLIRKYCIQFGGWDFLNEDIIESMKLRPLSLRIRGNIAPLCLIPMILRSDTI